MSSRVSIKSIGRAFRHRNYRLFFIGQVLSLLGTWMQMIAMSWLVYRLTNSAMLLGLVGFSGQIPMFLLPSLAGVFLDRWSRYRVFLATQVLSMVQASLLAFLTLTGNIAVWHLFVLAVFLGLVNTFDVPVRQAFVVDIIDDKSDLGNAIALNSTMFNTARLVGPSLAGLVIAAFGEGVCFLLNVVSFVAIIIALLLIRVKPQPRPRVWSNPLHGLKEGVRYAFDFRPIRYMLLLVAVSGLMGMQQSVLLPVVARDVLHGGAHTYGFLAGAGGLGSLVTAVYMASRKTIVGLLKFVVAGSALFGAGLIAVSLSRFEPASLVFMFVAGLGMMAQNVSCNTVIQTVVDEDKRGRVMSLYSSAAMGMMPFGSLIAGGLASHIGAPATLAIAGGSLLVAGFLFSRKLPVLREVIRPIYVDRNIIPRSGLEQRPL